MAHGPIPSERARVEALRLLGLPRSAGADAVRATYVKLARELHPDLNPGDAESAARFQQIAAAYELLRRYHRHTAQSSAPGRPTRERPREFDERWWSSFGDRV